MSLTVSEAQADRWACPSCGRWIGEYQGGQGRAECSRCNRWCFPVPVALGQGGKRAHRRVAGAGGRILRDRYGVPVAVRWTDPVGLAEVAERLEVKRLTADRWRQRGLLPEPRKVTSGSPLWDWELDILPWAESTGRLPGQRADQEPEF